MATSYPSAIKSFSTKVDGIDDVMAADVNDMQNEIVAIQTELGTLPKGSHASVKARMADLEAFFDIAAGKTLGLDNSINFSGTDGVNVVFTTAFTNQGGAGVLAWPAGGATLMIPGTGTAVVGSGTSGIIPKFSGTNTIANSLIYDNGSAVCLNNYFAAYAVFTVYKSTGTTRFSVVAEGAGDAFLEFGNTGTYTNAAQMQWLGATNKCYFGTLSRIYDFTIGGLNVNFGVNGYDDVLILKAYGYGAVFNEAGTNRFDLRIEGDTLEYLLFTDASTDRVGINDSAPGHLLDVGGDINSTGVYMVDDVQVISNRVIDARCDDAINSGDATTDGVIDSLRDAMITHGLIAAA